MEESSTLKLYQHFKETSSLNSEKSQNRYLHLQLSQAQVRWKVVFQSWKTEIPHADLALHHYLFINTDVSFTLEEGLGGPKRQCY